MYKFQSWFFVINIVSIKDGAVTGEGKISADHVNLENANLKIVYAFQAQSQQSFSRLL